MARPQQREDDDDDLGLSSDELDDEQRQGGGGGSQQLAAAFGAASDWVAGAVSSGNTAFTDAVKLQFYGLYKQATAGVCTAPQPAFWNRAARLKWDAWHKLGPLPSAEAMQRYCELLTQLAPQWQQQTGGGSTGLGAGGEDSTGTSGRGGEAPAGAGGAQRRGGGGGGFGPVFSVMAQEEDGGAGDGGQGEDGSAEGEAGHIHELAGKGDVAAVQALLASGVSPDARDAEGCTALHFAADRGQPEVAQALIAAGADVNALDHDGSSPLHYAALCGNQHLAELLLSAGADAALQDSSGSTAKALAPPGWDFLA